MLRVIVMLLVLANAVYFAWSHGYLAAYGLAPVTQAEPQRLAQQIRPEAMRIVGLNEPRDAAPTTATATTTTTATTTATATEPAVLAAAETASECLQAGLFNEAQSAALTTALSQALPAGSWSLENMVEPARWIVYMGRYADSEAAIKKKGELRGLGVTSELVKGAPLAPGLALGAYATEPEAVAGLALLSRRGVKTAKVKQERPELSGQRLKLPSVSAAMRSQLEDVKPQLAGRALLACAA